VTVTASSGKKLKLKIVVVQKKRALKKLTVKKPGPMRTKAKRWVISKGKTASLKPGLTSKKSTNVSVTFKSSDKRVVKVDKVGKLWPQGKGKAVVTVKAKQKGGKVCTFRKAVLVN
jgi:hypothetical protein